MANASVQSYSSCTNSDTGEWPASEPLDGSRLESESRLSPLGKTAGSREKLSEHTCTGYDGLAHPEVFPVRRRETSRRGSGILQPVQQCERLPDQSCFRLRFDTNVRI